MSRGLITADTNNNHVRWCGVGETGMNAAHNSQLQYDPGFDLQRGKMCRNLQFVSDSVYDDSAPMLKPDV